MPVHSSEQIPESSEQLFLQELLHIQLGAADRPGQGDADSLPGLTFFIYLASSECREVGICDSDSDSAKVMGVA
jgi:hypothetical protein